MVEPAPAPAAVAPLAVAAIPPAATPPASGWDRLKTRLFDGHYTRRYLRSVEAEYAKFTFLGVKHLALEKIYVGLQVGDYAPRDLLPDGAAARADDSSGLVPPAGTPVDVPTALSLSPSLLVLGDPGSGKTTLLRYLALKLARRDPLLAPFARARIPRRGALLLERICRGLSSANVIVAGFYSSLAASCVRNGLQRDRAIQRHQAAALLHRQRQQMDVGHLTGSEDGIPGNSSAIEDAHGIRPEDVMAGRSRRGEAFGDGPGRPWVGVAGL